MSRSLLVSTAVLALALTGCPTDDDDDATDCDSTEGVLRICTCWDEQSGDLVDDAMVAVRVDLDDPLPLEALVGPDGCTEVSLEAGTWEWSARTNSLNCVSPFEAVEVTACQTVEHKVDLMDWCAFGG